MKKTKSLRNLSVSLKSFTDDELSKELRRRLKKRKGPVIGYRAYCYGDTLNYGGYSDYIIGERWDKDECKRRAGHCVADSENGGYVEVLYKDTPKPTRKIH